MDLKAAWRQKPGRRVFRPAPRCLRSKGLRGLYGSAAAEASGARGPAPPRDPRRGVRVQHPPAAPVPLKSPEGGGQRGGEKGRAAHPVPGGDGRPKDAGGGGVQEPPDRLHPEQGPGRHPKEEKNVLP